MSVTLHPRKRTAGGHQNETLEKVTPALNIAIFGTYVKDLIMAGQPTLPGPRTPPRPVRPYDQGL